MTPEPPTSSGGGGGELEHASAALGSAAATASRHGGWQSAARTEGGRRSMKPMYSEPCNKEKAAVELAASAAAQHARLVEPIARDATLHATDSSSGGTQGCHVAPSAVRPPARSTRRREHARSPGS